MNDGFDAILNLEELMKEWGKKMNERVKWNKA